MAVVVRRAEVAAPSGEVWATLADFAAISSWAPNVDHSCLLSAQTEGTGTTRRIQTDRTTVVETVETWDPGAAFSYRITGLPPVIRSVTNTWTLADAGGSTRVELTTEVDAGPRPPQQLIAKVAGRRLAAASEQMLAGLKHAIERSHA